MPGKSGLHARGKAERVLALESRASRSFSECLGEVRVTVEMGVASRDSTGFVLMEEGLISG